MKNFNIIKTLKSFLIYGVRNKLITFISNLKLSPHPPFIYKPQGYKVTGEDIREISKLVKSGDIILRGFNRYVSSYFLGEWSHVGIMETNTDIIHSISKGVVRNDLFEFLKTDHVIILRPNLSESETKFVINKVKNYIGVSCDFDFEMNDDSLYCSELLYYSFSKYRENLGIIKQQKTVLFNTYDCVEPKDYLSFSGFSIVGVFGDDK